MQKAPMKTASHRCEAPRFDGKVKTADSREKPASDRTDAGKSKGGKAQGGHSPSLARTNNEARDEARLTGEAPQALE